MPFPSPTISWSFLKFMSIELVVLSNHLILCCPLLLLPSISPSIRVISKRYMSTAPPTSAPASQDIPAVHRECEEFQVQEPPGSRQVESLGGWEIFVLWLSSLEPQGRALDYVGQRALDQAGAAYCWLIPRSRWWWSGTAVADFDLAGGGLNRIKRPHYYISLMVCHSCCQKLERNRKSEQDGDYFFFPYICSFCSFCPTVNKSKP